MKTRLIIFLLFTVFVINNCYNSSDKYLSKLTKISVINGELTNDQIVEIKDVELKGNDSRYCILLNLSVVDSQISGNTKTINQISQFLNPINYMYAAFDPKREIKFFNSDSIVEISIRSLYDINDSIRAGQILNNYFSAYYLYFDPQNQTGVYKVALKEGYLNFNHVVNFKLIEYWRPINKINNPGIAFVLNIQPIKSSQRFIVNVKLKSSKMLCDTTS